MSHAFTLTLPDELYESIRRNAQATKNVSHVLHATETPRKDS